MARNMLSREYTGSLKENGQAEARWLLADRVSRVLAGAELQSVAGPHERVVRLAVPAGRVDPFRWLHEQRMFPKTYWSGREERGGVAAVGAADIREAEVSEGAGSLPKLLASVPDSGDSGARYYGGMRFDPLGKPDAEWEAFGAYRFVLPRFELHAGDAEATLVCNLVLPRDLHNTSEILEQIEDLSLPEGMSGVSLPIPVFREDSPGLPGWRENIERALYAFSEGRLGKVVLARRAEIGFDRDLDPTLLLECLQAATPECFHFYAEPESGVAFLGASPERLFRRDGRSVVSEAVAGTRPRGVSSEDDEGLRKDLLHSVKDLSEHSYVRIGIRESLEPLCEELELGEDISDMKLTRGRHLRSKVRGTLLEGVTDAGLLEALHPTPAVGGYPRGEALDEIRNLEPFDRGWYAGPVGWIGADASEFAVGLRSGLVRGRTLALFSGAGIVAGSVPDEEWAEIEQKIGDFTGVFGLEQGNAAS
ncbi:MAG: isochorismate synthase [Rubrobacteraceae bacterium]|nr:isochorismate synthase [Rubrobacteraceae bacterium]